MFKKWINRLAQIASSTFGASKEDGLTLEGSLTKFERFFHFWVLVCRSFVRNRCPVRASALSYTTMLAMIPVLAVAIGVTNAILESKGEAQIRGFIEQFVEKMVPTPETNRYALTAPLPDWTKRLDEIQFNVERARALSQGPVLFSASSNSAPLLLTGSTPLAEAAVSSSLTNSTATNSVETAAAGMTQAKQSVAKQAANFIYDFAKKSSSTTLGFTGMFFLILTAIMTLTRVEETFNDIWGVTRGRDWWSRITNYTFTIGFGPVLLILALGLMNGPNFQKSRDIIRVVPFLEPVMTSVLPLVIICFTFAIFYKLVPNTRVDFGAALVGGSLAGIAWHGYNQLGWLLASRAVSASAVYGSLFIIPLLMGGLYMVWLTVLFGAQVAYAFQNRASYLQDRLVENVNQRGREFVALRLMTCIGQRFHRGLPPATVREISVELGIPSKLVQQVMRTLLAAHLVVEVSGAEAGYSPARPLETINCHHILVAMRATHGQEPATRDEPVRIEVLGEFARIQAAEEQAAAAVSMLALVNRAQARLELAAPPEPGKPINVAADVTAVDAPMFASAAVASTPPVSFTEPVTPKPITIKPTIEQSELVSTTEPQPVAAAPTNAPTPATPDDENRSFPL
jgi:membrane protein